MDDVVAGADSVQEALERKHQLMCLIEKGGFILRRWSSNCDTVLANVPLNEREQYVFYTDTHKSLKIHALSWDPSSYHLSYSVETFTAAQPSKRTILFYNARIFDPFG